MTYKKKPTPPAASWLSVRVSDEQKAIIIQAAEREGLQLSSFILKLLVAERILPADCLKKLKRRPVPFFNELHSLIGAINNMGGNCKQLADALPDTEGLRQTHASLIQASSAICDIMLGKRLPEGVNLYQLQGDLIKEGHVFNDIVKSVNVGKPSLARLPAVLASIAKAANAVTSSLNGNPVGGVDALMEKAMEDIRTSMKKAAVQQTKRQT